MNFTFAIVYIYLGEVDLYLRIFSVVLVMTDKFYDICYVSYSVLNLYHHLLWEFFKIDK